MFQINEDNSIYLTRGDSGFINVTAKDKQGNPYTFMPGETLRMKVYAKKNCENVVLQKDFPITEVAQTVQISLEEKETKIGKVISKPVTYWYELELNPLSDPQTIIGYGEDGPALFMLYPEGRDLTEDDPIIKPEDIPIVDTELDLFSKRPVENQVVARAFLQLEKSHEKTHEAVAKLHVTPEMFGAIGDGKADDTEAVQNALNAGGRVTLSKAYKVTALTMHGGVLEGYGATLIGSSGDVAITAESASEIRGLTITDAHIGVLVKGNECRIQNCKLKNINNRSVVIYNASNCSIINCCFKNTGGILMQGEKGGTVKNNTVDGCTLDGITTDMAIYLNSSFDTLQITGCVINNCFIDRYTAVGVFVGGDFNTVSNCKIGKLKNDSVSAEPPRPLWVHDGKGNVVEGCHFIECPRGLYIINARDTIISNCVFENIAYYNINAIYNDSETAVYAGVAGNSGVTIRGCVFTRGSGTYSAILIDSFKNVVVSDCELRDGIMERLLRSVRSKYAEIASSVIISNCFCDSAFGIPINMYNNEELLYCQGVIDKNGVVFNLS